MAKGVSDDLSTVIRRDVKELRTTDIGNKIVVQAYIDTITSVYLYCDLSHWECPSCGNVLIIKQDEFDFKKPSKPCKCGRKTTFRNFKNDLVEFRLLYLRRESEPLIAVVKGEPAFLKFKHGDYIEFLGYVDYKLEKRNMGPGTKGSFYLEVERILEHHDGKKVVDTSDERDEDEEE